MKTSKVRTIAIASVAAVLMALTLVISSISFFPPKGNAIASTTTITQEYLRNGNFSVIVPSLSSTPCARSFKSEPLAFRLEVNSESAALLCVAYYYYNTSVSMNLIPSSQLRIFGWPIHATGTYSPFDASSNFTIISSASSIDLGGPTALNEGAEVTYRIQAKAGVNGIFEVNVANILPGGIGCEGDFLLQAGTGVPSYAAPGLCYLTQYNPTSNSPIPQGYLFVAFIGATNSTV
jgi:hypothetical protein